MARATKTKTPRAAGEKLLSTSEVLELFHEAGMTDMTIRSIDRMCNDRDLPFTKVANRRRFRRDAIITYINDLFEQAA